MRFEPPSYRRLGLTWAALVALTVMSMLGGGAVTGDAAQQALGFVRVGLILLVTFFKSYHVMMYFLNLRTSTLAWKSVYLSGLGLICAFILLVYLAASLQ